MRRTPPFQERIQEAVLLCDGAMGTYLYELGIPLDHCFPEQNLEAPHLVERIHREYVDAGADILETNTYQANRRQLERFGLDDHVRKINVRGCRLARQAAEGRCYVAGSVGPLGIAMEPLGPLSREEALELFREQMEALAEGGADLLMIETISDLDEMDVALEAARQACDLPVVAQKTFTEDGRTLMGELPHEVVERGAAGGATAVGANCTVGPQRMLDIIRRMASRAELPLVAQPTAGLPRLVEGRVTYFAEPDYMGHYARRLAEAGARVVGACCGSRPEHIAAMAGALEDVELEAPGQRVAVEETEAEPREPVPLERRSELAGRLGEDFVVAVDLALPRGHDLEATLRLASRYVECGAETVVLSDGLSARLRLHPVVAAYRLREELGLEAVLVYSSRDRNLLGIQSDLLGAHVLGVRNVLVSSADPASVGDYPTATHLTDVDSVGLVRILDGFNRGLDLAGNPIGEPTAFLPLALADPVAHDPEAELQRLTAKVESGAAALVTTPVFDLGILDRFLERIDGLGVPVVVGLLPLRSARHADFLHNEVPGMVVPGAVRGRLEAAADPAREGLEIGRELLHELPARAAGVHVVPAWQDPDRTVSALRVLDLPGAGRRQPARRS